ncbi:hypothetical protein [Thalassotalea montiporae]
MVQFLRVCCQLAVLISTGISCSVQANLLQYDLSFTTSGQSIWDTGDSFMLDQRSFLGAQWQDQQVDIDLIAGREDVNVINPLRTAYDIAFAGCRALGNSSSTCINGQSGRIFVPKLGSRPSVRSCSRFAVACKIARAADLTRRAAYDAAFSLCRKSFSSSVCRNGQSARLPVAPLGTAPPSFLEVDTRTGVAVQGSTDGRVGIELGIEIDSGSVDATVSYQATLDLPDTLNLDKTNPINFNANSLLAGANTLDTSFANLALNIDAIMELSGTVGGEACIIPAGCSTGSTPFNINERASILSFNQDGEGGVSLLGQQPSVFGFPDQANGFPFSVDALGIVEATLHLPQPNASGGLNVNTNTLIASGQDDLVDLFIDIDNIVATAAGVPGLFGSSAPIGSIGSIGYDIIDVQMGPTIDLKQDFELEPTLFVSMVFDKAVMVGGEMVTELISAWDLLPDITFLDDVTTVTPTFFLDANLTNETLLDFDLELMIDLLQINFDILGFDRQIGIGNVLAAGADLFQSPNLFVNMFPLGGFDLQVGESFVVDFNNNTPPPPTTLAVRSAINPIEAFAVSVPTPSSVLLMLIALSALVLSFSANGNHVRKRNTA